jgi:hypothetical protein
VFWRLVLARIIEPTNKLDSLRVLSEVGIDPPSYPMMNRSDRDRRVATGAGVSLHGRMPRLTRDNVTSQIVCTFRQILSGERK